jgi:hypothetical protein
MYMEIASKTKELITDIATDCSKVTGAEALGRMLRYRRPGRSKTERRFIKYWLLPLGLETDGYGNLYRKIGDSNVMWSCHTDTVHRVGGVQNIVIDKHNMITLAKSETLSNCLGADDTAGVWLMREMILAGKPGLYVFHRDEEHGGYGSAYIAKHEQSLLSGIEIAIAFDRRGVRSVITHQGTRCCSDEFATTLASGLGMSFRLDDGGIFTDTANYTDLIPECTNISVGYYDEHSRKESLDVSFLLNLRQALIDLDTNDLVVARDPMNDNDFPGARFDIWDRHSNRMVDFEAVYGMTLFDLVREFPDETVDFLETYGIDANDLIKHIEQLGGLNR